MAILALDLGGTKLAYGVFTAQGKCIHAGREPLKGRGGEAVGELMQQVVIRETETHSTADPIEAIGISIPGKYDIKSGRVWAPNIPDWEDFPLLELIAAVTNVSVRIDSDRACCILGEVWQGSAQGSRDAIFITVGTGIGAGIWSGGRVLRGSGDLAGAIGWMALGQPYLEEYKSCGYFEYYASGEGIARQMRRRKDQHAFRDLDPEQFRARYVFEHSQNNPHARQILEVTIALWGMGTANLISIFNPEIVVFGGGVFGPASPFLDRIRQEASRWAQPLAMQEVRLELSELSGRAALFGAAYQCMLPESA